jgi:predicted ATPase
MIDYLKISNFKSLKDAPLDLKNLNILAGLNGMGKSTIIQSLLLLRQSFNKGLLNSFGLVLKGEYVELGTGKDVFYQGAGEDQKIKLDCVFSGETFKWVFDYSPEKHVLPLNNDSEIGIINTTTNSLFNNNFQYINAEHISPLSLHQKSQLDVVENRQIGTHGEYAVHYLVEFGDRENIQFENLRHPNARTNNLIHNVDAWLSEISPGIRIKLEDLLSVDSAKLGFEFETLNGYTNEFRPVNVGFGLFHILPVLVSILSAGEDKLILIENPESHIHPRGQSVIGDLLYKAAQNNIQLIVETHSDHVLNGIRVSTFRQQSGSERVGLFFFERNSSSDEHFSEILTPILDNNGRINSWPSGFFDEWENTLIELV